MALGRKGGIMKDLANRSKSIVHTRNAPLDHSDDDSKPSKNLDVPCVLEPFAQKNQIAGLELSHRCFSALCRN